MNQIEKEDFLKNGYLNLKTDFVAEISYFWIP